MKFMSPVYSLALAFLALAVVCAGSASAQEIKAGGLLLGHAWARATPSGAEVGGGYLTIENKGTAPDKLLGGSSPAACRFRKLHPFDSRSPANQNMIAGCSLLPSFSSACCATVSSRDDRLKPKFWCCGINSTSCSSARHIGYV